jgi:ubiquinone/menaquinone biosynthesis C-methylase UbiE
VKQLTACDISSRMIEIAREKAVTQKVENVRFDRATLFAEDLEKGPFDVVMGFNFLHLLDDIPGAVHRVKELLKPGGLFISKTVCLAEQSRLWSIPLAVMKLLGFAPYVKCLKVAELELPAASLSPGSRDRCLCGHGVSRRLGLDLSGTVEVPGPWCAAL